MSDIEFLAKLTPKKLTSLDEDHKVERKAYLADEARYKRYGTNNQKLADLMASGQLLPASELVRVREEQEQAVKAFEESVQSELSHQKTKMKSGIEPAKPIYTREQFND